MLQAGCIKTCCSETRCLLWKGTKHYSFPVTSVSRSV